ncbi:methyltransferase domain-containing protein [Streptacidiphilus sp. BW17]|uniref:methyltransferase domain-containing protein n=1 Tax=Streptacidiphilus sp. BW17 TaxID=3156274 RepID=UPI003517C915
MRKLTAALISAGSLPADWGPLFLAVPRMDFTPDRIHTGEEWIDKAADPERWAELVTSDAPLVTQLDDGEPNGPGIPTSSSSMPTVVALMLRHLDVQPRMRVLDIGTGTGWTSALLTAFLGDDAVTTIEVDQAVAQAAHEHLARAGVKPRTVLGDGYAGHADDAPYDRIHSTASVQQVPQAWIEQTRPGGVIVTPFGTTLCNGALLKLVVHEDGSAAGRFVEDVSFMWIRSQRPAQGTFNVPKGIEYSPSAVDPTKALGAHVATFAAGLILPGVRTADAWYDPIKWGTARTEVWDGTSYAHCRWADWEAPHAVASAGPRRLWDEVSAVHGWWEAQGQPSIEQFGLTVTPDGEHQLWLDDPVNPLPGRTPG